MFIPINHPEVRTGKKSEEEVLGEFLDNIESYSSIMLGEKKDMTLEQFIEYYSMISFQIIDDKYFDILMCCSWSITKSPKKDKAWTEDY